MLTKFPLLSGSVSKLLYDCCRLAMQRASGACCLATTPTPVCHRQRRHDDSSERWMIQMCAMSTRSSSIFEEICRMKRHQADPHWEKEFQEDRCREPGGDAGHARGTNG